MAASPPATAVTTVLLTVDVESRAAEGGTPETDVYGRIPGARGEFGVPRILELLRAHRAPATFYLNVYESARFGDGPVADIARQVLADGQDLELHTHPGAMYARALLSDFDLEQQERILAHGRDLIRQWTGHTAVAHRAGGFKANADTLQATARVGIEVDASLSPAGSCPLVDDGYAQNDVFTVGPTLLLPVTYYEQLHAFGRRSLRFVDIESSSFAEIRHVMDAMAARHACAVNIMMHSFSLVRYGTYDERIARKLEAVLAYANSRPEFRLSTTQEFLASFRQGRLDCSPQPGFVPYTGVLMTYSRAWERFDDGWKNVAFALLPPFALLSSATSLVFAVRARRRRRGHV